MSFAQERLWFLAQIEGGSKAYQNLHGLQLRGELDRTALRRALNQIVARHEALRTVFALVDGKPSQRIAGERDSQFHLIEHDLRECDGATAEFDRLMAEEASTPIDLQAGPLIRGRLIRQGNEEYVLLITIHHIVSDAWSFGVFSKELSALYRAYVRGEEDDLPELEIQYADYAVWQRKRMEGEVLGKQAEYWKRALAGAPEVLQLPADRVRPEQQSYSGAAARLVLDEELTAGLRGLSRKHKTTLYMTVLAGWAALLARLSGQDEVVIGTPAANRNRVEIERLIGFFVNTLALRLGVSNLFDVGALLAHVRSQAVAAQEHQGIPFEQVVEIVRPPRSLAHNPVFQVMFAWQNAPKGTIDLAGLQVSPFAAVPHNISKFDLTLLLQEEGNQIVGELEYATALYERSTIERYLGYFRTLLGAMVADDSYKVDRLPILPQEERHQLLYEWNDTRTEFPADKCVHQLFEEQVARTPDAVALVFEGEELNYAQLNARANRLAHYLRELGVRPDERVAICVERGLEMIVGLLGVLKAGGAYVPLDPAYPAERLRFMLEDSAPVVLLTQSHLEKLLVGIDSSLPVLDLASATPPWQGHPETNLAPDSVGLGPRHLAYVIYTSGSTGMPKGVGIEHSNVVNFISWSQSSFPSSALERTLFSTSLNFDLAVFECFVPLACGAMVTIVPNALELARIQVDATLINTVPSAMSSLVEAGRVPQTVLTINLAGEPLKRALVEKIFATTQVSVVCNLYGPSETTTYSTWVAMQRNQGFVSHIGRPIANTRIYILDAHGEPVPVGVAGELYIGGTGVARGYLNRPELTAEKFLKDPFTDDVNGRMYRTGDLGRWLRDGNIEFLGRNDFQVKIRGFRIELGEIETRLMEHPAVREAVVVVREEAPDGKRLVAYYTTALNDGAEANAPGAEQLRLHLSASLPEYMVPAAYMRLESLPLTPNGKLDRKALPSPEGDANVVRQYEAPQGTIEELLAGIWAELLNRERVGRHDNFFELGGHSLMAVTLVDRLAQAGLKADVRALFATPTLAGLATTIGGDTHKVEVPPNLIPAGCQVITPEMLTLVELSQEEIDEIVRGVPGGAANVQDIYPLAPLQEGILFHHLMGGEGDPYVVAMQFAFDSRTRLDRYITALRAVIDRHDILRTAVVWEGLRERVQVVWRRAELAVEEIELDGALGDAREQLYARCHPRRMRIDVRQAPLLRLCIGYDSIQDRWLMVQLLHHLAGDHTTLEVMYAEVQAHLRKEEASLPEPLPFRNLVAQARLGVSQEEHEAFFRQMLGNVEEPTAPFGLLDVQGDGSRIEDAHLAVEEEVAGRLRRQARRLGVSVASLCHLAWAQVLAKVSEREDVVFGTVLFGRMQGGQGADRVMGLFINTLPVRIRAGEEGVEAGVRRVHSLLSDLLGHEHASLALVQRCSQVEPPAPLFSALLNYRHTPTAASSQESLQAWEGIEALRTEERTNYPLALSVSDFGEGFSLAAQTLVSIGPLRICRYMHTALASLAEALETCPAKAVRALEILPHAERRQLLYEWNDTRAPFPSEKCIHELFEEQVARTPDAVALAFEGKELNYAQLNARANQLAHYLRELGVKPDDRVAICAERGLEMVVGLLGVLKAGGAYVPLDPTFPAERLRFMLEDSAPVVLLTQTRLENFFVKSDVRPIVLLDGVGAGWMTLYGDRNPRFDETRFDEIGVTAQNLACIIYTSGSTGTSKGVAVQHGGIVNLVHDWTTRFGNRVRRDALQASLWTSFGFDVSIFELFAGFCLSATINIVPEQIRGDSRALYAWFFEHNIAFGYLPLFFMRDAQQMDASISPLHFELVLAGVEPSTESTLYQLQKNTPRLQIVNGYGPAETTVFSTTYAEIGNRSRNTPIGRPLANTRIYILDAYGEPVPVGVTGELYIGGAGVARGYLSRPELTAERFVQDPFTAEAGARMYRTGDLGRWLADGNIEFLGRNDFQVKIRGFRIELGEIEARLSEHNGVREAVVLAREDTPGGKRLVAYYTAREQNSVGARELRAHVAMKLPEYMVPAAYVRLESLPLTPNGKLNRKALPAPEGDAYVLREYEAPQGSIEELLAVIWAELLHLERVGRHDNFFALGGHSLMAVTLVERLARAGLKADVRALFAKPTLAELAASFDTNAPALETPASRIPSPQKTTSSSRIVELSI